jgi:hypothetical protein
MAAQNGNIYRKERDALGWSRELAAEKLIMSNDKLERIENNKQIPNPLDVLTMSDVYCAPELCNYYCHYECEIGREYVPEITESNLPNIVIKLLDSVYRSSDIHRVLLNITADGTISDDELPIFIKIQDTLEELSQATEELQICIEKKIDNKEISKDLYDDLKRTIHK